MKLESAELLRFSSNWVAKCYQLGVGGTAVYPYEVGYVPDQPQTPIYFAEGDAKFGSGGFFTATQALEPQWVEHLKTAGVIWFVPFLQRLAAGNIVALEEILKVFKSIHGHEPDVLNF